LVSRTVIGVVVVLVIAVIAAGVFLSYPTGMGSTTNSNSSSGSSGKMAVMGTDPYSSGTGDQEYYHYNNVAAHKTQSGGQSTTTSTTTASGGGSSGWVLLNASGTMHLNALVNASQTLALANIAAGTYDSIRLYVDSAIVTYNGVNYTAHTGSGMITASLNGNAQVSGSATTAVIFDLRTVAVNTASSSSPAFVVTSSARAEVIPSSDVASASLQIGAKVDLSGSAWFQTFARGNAHMVISAAAISASSLSLTVKDTGAETANATLVIVTPVSVLSSAQVVIPDNLSGSAVFVVGPSGSLTAVASASLLAEVSSPGSGASITSSSSATLTFSSTIQFQTTLGATVGVQAGQSYLITVIGTNTVASTTVTAS
jgi:hypothetical protein